MTTIKEVSADKLYGTKPELVILDDVEFDALQHQDIQVQEVKSNKPYWRNKERW